MTQLDLATDPDRERLLTDAAVVLGDLLLELGVPWQAVGLALPELGDAPPSALAHPDYRRLPLADRLRTWIARHDLACRDSRARVVVAAIGDCTPRSTTEARWHRRVLAVVARGEYPSGRAVRGSHHSNTSLGPTERAYRAEVLTDLGWVEVRRGDASARWVAPEGTTWWHFTPASLQRAARRRRAEIASGACP